MREGCFILQEAFHQAAIQTKIRLRAYEVGQASVELQRFSRMAATRGLS